jgi:probable rRNA maturation factor
MIEINNLTTVSVNEEFLKKVAEKVLEGETAVQKTGTRNKDLSIALVGQGRIRELNKKYRGENRVTDVLAFGDNDGLGEIVICLREVKKNAKRFKSTFEKELAQVLIHGILHLLGYDHEKNEIEAKKMEEKQNYYLGLCQKLIL